MVNDHFEDKRDFAILLIEHRVLCLKIAIPLSNLKEDSMICSKSEIDSSVSQFNYTDFSVDTDSTLL